MIIIISFNCSPVLSELYGVWQCYYCYLRLLTGNRRASECVHELVKNDTNSAHKTITILYSRHYVCATIISSNRVAQIP